MTDISDYDKFDYDYTTYWNKRGYENSAEKHILNKIFYTQRGKWFLDIGGSYGRLTSTYYEQYDKSIILDYSLKTLQRNRETLLNKYPNTELIAANAYKMPFKQNSFDGALMVRVLHHIEKPGSYFKELKRVLGDNASYIQEYANKIHIKARIKALIKLNFDIYSKEPYQQPTVNTPEGSKEDQESIFYNYHPKYIKDLLKENNFQIEKKFGCSFLRSPFIKKLMSENLMMFFEKLMQITLSWTDISPSIILETKLLKNSKEKQEANELKDILVCPSCKETLLFHGDDSATCEKCSQTFFKKDGIWDFRVK